MSVDLRRRGQIVVSVAQQHRSGKLLPLACKEYGSTQTQVERWANADPRLKEILDDAKRDFNNVLKNALLAPMAAKDVNPFGTGDIREATLLSNNIKWALEHDSEDQRFTPRMNVKNEITGTVVVEALSRFDAGLIPHARPPAGGVVITTEYAEVKDDYDEMRETPIMPPLPSLGAGKPLPLPPVPLPIRQGG